MNHEEIKNARRWLVEVADLIADPDEQTSDALATLSAGLRILDENTLNSLEHVARLIAANGEEFSDGECLDEVWNYLLTLGINPDIYRTETAPAQITDVTTAAASPRFTASAPHPLRSAVNPCTDGEPSGWGVFCSDTNSEWLEINFADEEAAERFAQAWTTYDENNTAKTGLVIIDNRNTWEGDNCTAATTCTTCNQQTEFKGWHDAQNTAHFPCDNCGTIFTISDWYEFQNENETR